MDATTAKGQQDQYALLDVREQPEWDAGHIAGAVHIPMTELNTRQQEIPTDRPIVCVCRSGQRSAMVTQALVGAGFDAQNLDGGMLAWAELKAPIVTDDGSPGTVI
jgi:rhodanese-related sulfurtransferase